MTMLQDAAVTVVGILTQTNIRGDHDLRHLVFELLDGVLDDTALGMRLGAGRVLFLRQTKEQNMLDAQAEQLLCLNAQLIDAHAAYAEHGGISSLFPLPGMTKMG